MRLRYAEEEPTYRALVGELAYSLTPTSIMGLTIVAIGLIVWSRIHDADVIWSTTLGGLGSVLKIALTITQRRRVVQQENSTISTLRFEAMQGSATIVVASSVGGLAATIFWSADQSSQMLATALVFGYCSGIVSRVSIRPHIAATAIAIGAAPSIIACGMTYDNDHLILSIVFAAFLAGAFESIVHAYRVAYNRVALQLRMAKLARIDPLTGLANRLAFHESFDELHKSPHGLVAVHAFDLDGFKAVNDLYGHATGDLLLKSIADRVRSSSRASDQWARVGGDEFICLQSGIKHYAEASAYAGRIHETLTKPYLIEGTTHHIGLSLGYTVSVITAAKLDVMTRAADNAAYQAKRLGGGVFNANTVADLVTHRDKLL